MYGHFLYHKSKCSIGVRYQYLCCVPHAKELTLSWSPETVAPTKVCSWPLMRSFSLSSFGPLRSLIIPVLSHAEPPQFKHDFFGYLSKANVRFLHFLHSKKRLHASKRLTWKSSKKNTLRANTCMSGRVYTCMVPFYHWSINAQKIMTSDVNSDLMSLGLAQVWLSVSGVAALRARDNFWLDFQGVDHLVFHRLFLFRTVKIPLLLLSLSLVRQVRAFRLCLKKGRYGWLQTW